MHQYLKFEKQKKSRNCKFWKTEKYLYKLKMHISSKIYIKLYLIEILIFYFTINFNFLDIWFIIFIKKKNYHTRRVQGIEVTDPFSQVAWIGSKVQPEGEPNIRLGWAVTLRDPHFSYVVQGEHNHIEGCCYATWTTSWRLHGYKTK